MGVVQKILVVQLSLLPFGIGCAGAMPNHSHTSLPAAEALLAGLRGPTRLTAPWERWGAIMAIGKQGTHEAAKALATVLDNPGQFTVTKGMAAAEDVVAFAAIAMVYVRDAAAVPLILERLGHESPLVRAYLVEALGRLGGVAAVRAIARIALNDPERWVRFWAPYALRFELTRHPKGSAREALRQVVAADLSSSDPVGGASDALHWLDDPGAGVAVARAKQRLPRRRNQESLQDLLATLGTAEGKRRGYYGYGRDTLVALIDIADPGMSGKLRQVILDDDHVYDAHYVAEVAARAYLRAARLDGFRQLKARVSARTSPADTKLVLALLEQWDAPRAGDEEMLVWLAGVSDPAVSSAALSRIGLLTTTMARDTLCQALADTGRDQTVRRVAATALAAFPTSARLQCLADALDSTPRTPDVLRTRAAELLRRATGFDHGPDPDRWRRSLRQALGTTPSQRIAALGHEKRGIRIAAANDIAGWTDAAHKAKALPSALKLAYRPMSDQTRELCVHWGIRRAGVACRWYWPSSQAPSVARILRAIGDDIAVPLLRLGHRHTTRQLAAVCSRAAALYAMEDRTALDHPLDLLARDPLTRRSPWSEVRDDWKIMGMLSDITGRPVRYDRAWWLAHRDELRPPRR